MPTISIEAIIIVTGNPMFVIVTITVAIVILGFTTSQSSYSPATSNSVFKCRDTFLTCNAGLCL